MFGVPLSVLLSLHPLGQLPSQAVPIVLGCAWGISGIYELALCFSVLGSTQSPSTTTKLLRRCQHPGPLAHKARDLNMLILQPPRVCITPSSAPISISLRSWARGLAMRFRTGLGGRTLQSYLQTSPSHLPVPLPSSTLNILPSSPETLKWTPKHSTISGNSGPLVYHTCSHVAQAHSLLWASYIDMFLLTKIICVVVKIWKL